MDKWDYLIVDETMEFALLSGDGGNVEQKINLPPDSILINCYWNGYTKTISLADLVTYYQDNVLRIK